MKFAMKFPASLMVFVCIFTYLLCKFLHQKYEKNYCILKNLFYLCHAVES